MNRQPPVIEILLACCNGEAYLRAQLDSLLAQTDDRWHLTVSDDGSSDATLPILEQYSTLYPDKISLHRSGRRFGSARDHFFHLMRRCTSPYMMFCDQDDVWYPDKVQKTFDALLAAEAQYGSQTPLLVFTDQTPTDAHLVPLASSLMRYQDQRADEIDFRSLLMRNIVTGCAMAINRALAEKGGQCQNDAQAVMHDWWLAVVAARFGRVIYLNETTMFYRQHGANSVGAKNVRSFSHVAGMLAHLNELRQKIAAKKQQASLFSHTYSTELTPQDTAFLTAFCAPRSGPVFYWNNRRLIHGHFLLAGLMVLG